MVYVVVLLGLAVITWYMYRRGYFDNTDLR